MAIFIEDLIWQQDDLQLFYRLFAAQLYPAILHFKISVCLSKPLQGFKLIFFTFTIKRAIISKTEELFFIKKIFISSSLQDRNESVKLILIAVEV